MLTKVGYSDSSVVKAISPDDFQNNYASPEITNRLAKFASTIQAIAPRSKDFLYFTIIFLKSAESALIDEVGNTKKIGKEKAWGYFDENFRWSGNVKPHKNNNGDIFPEIELKKAARAWIGRPLCVDHKSDSVDGVRGIILDTHYDEKLKQVVGLCALDKVNYPDLSHKVQTGVVRYGSMGTAVATSICSDCGKGATSPKDYCDCIIKRRAWGEINVGLSPIEYSLVVQPAEPGAILLRCIASIEKHKSELTNYGLDVDSLVKNIDVKTASDLDLLLNSVCGPDGCSLEQRQRIVKGYLSTNGFTKSAQQNPTSYNRDLLSDLARFEDVFGVKYKDDPELYQKFFGDSLDVASGDKAPEVENLTSGQSAVGADTIIGKDDQDVSDYTNTGSAGLVAGVSEANPDSFKGDGVGPENYAFSEAKNDRIKLSSITEEIMNESRLRKRAALRRRLAYPQGGEGAEAEPKTYKDEGAQQKKIREQDDRHMLTPTNLGGTDGVVPGDKEIKEKQLRANDKGTEKRAYHYGGAAPALEPSTFKSEDYHKYWDDDKHMHQTKSMGGENGMFPGDESIKEHQKRAKYEGPALSTKFKQRRGLDGKINKAASCFEVYSGGKLVIAATAGDIFGKTLNENWEWIASQDYAKTVVAEIREKGLYHVGRLLTKTAQAQDLALPEDPMAAPEMGADLPADASVPGDVPDDLGGAPEDADQSPKVIVEDSLIAMEDTIEKVRDAVSQLGGEDVDVNVNVGGEPGAEVVDEKMALSHNVLRQLKIVLAEAQESADELALLAETYDRYGKLSVAQKKDLRVLSSDALKDCSTILGQSKALVSMAGTISKSLVKTSEYVEKVPVKVASTKPVLKSSAKPDDELVVKAMELRKQRRQAMLKKAQEMEEESLADDEEKKEEEPKENEAHDGIGMKENAKVSGVAKDTAEDIATKAPKGGDHKASPSTGNQDAQQFDSYKGTPSRQVAETSVKSVKQNKAEDMDMENKAADSKVKAIAEDEAEEEVEEHEEVMHDKENDAKDKELTTPAQEKLASSFLKKKAEDEREAYRIKLRRAYDIAMEMQRKGMLAATRPALNQQVDNMMDFDDKAFESFKRTVANFQGEQSVKTAGLADVNIGINEDTEPTNRNTKVDAKSLASLWE